MRRCLTLSCACSVDANTGPIADNPLLLQIAGDSARTIEAPWRHLERLVPPPAGIHCAGIQKCAIDRRSLPPRPLQAPPSGTRYQDNNPADQAPNSPRLTAITGQSGNVQQEAGTEGQAGRSRWNYQFPPDSSYCNRLKMSVPLVPPKPKEFDKTTRTNFRSCAVVGNIIQITARRADFPN